MKERATTLFSPHLAQRAQCLRFAQRLWKVELSVEPDSRGHGAVDELVEVGKAKRGEHLVDVLPSGSEVTGDEGSCAVWPLGCGLRGFVGMGGLGHGACVL